MWQDSCNCLLYSVLLCILCLLLPCEPSKGQGHMRGLLVLDVDSWNLKQLTWLTDYLFMYLSNTILYLG